MVLKYRGWWSFASGAERKQALRGDAWEHW